MGRGERWKGETKERRKGVGARGTRGTCGGRKIQENDIVITEETMSGVGVLIRLQSSTSTVRRALT